MKRSFSHVTKDDDTTNKRAKMDLIMPSIPQDLWPLIASFMDDKTKRQMRLANTTWFNIIRYNKFNIYFARSENIQAISERLSKYSWPIELHFKKPKFNDVQDLLDYLPIITNLTDTSSDYAVRQLSEQTEKWLQLSTLTNLKSGTIGGYHLPMDLVTKFCKLTEWLFVLKKEEDATPILKLTNLESLKLKRVFNTWPFALGSKLTKLTIQGWAEHEQTEMWSHLTSVKQLIYTQYLDNNQIRHISYLTALEDLHLSCGEIPSLVQNTNLTQLEMRVKRPTTFDSLSNLKNMKILSLALPAQDYSPFNFLFLSHLEQLEQFTITNVTYSSRNRLTIPSESFVPYLRDSIKCLDFSFEVDVAHLLHLTNLQEFDLSKPALNNQDLALLSTLTKLALSDEEKEGSVIGKLTQLVELVFVTDQDQQDNSLPDLSGLVNLKKLNWGSDYCPSKIIDQLSCLTSLEEFDVSSSFGTGLELNHCNYLSALTNMKSLYLRDDVKVIDTESIWQSLAKLTNLEVLHLPHIDNDDQLLILTAMNNLTTLHIKYAAKEGSFDGRHLTALTSIQKLALPKQPMHSAEYLMKTLPYLWDISYFEPMDDDE